MLLGSPSSPGTEVQIYGSLDNDGGKPIPSWQCFIDGKLFGNTTTNGIRENGIKFCDSGIIPDGVHQVNVSTTTTGPIFYFDYIYYWPSSSVSLTNAVIKVDNTDPSLSFNGNGWRIRYGDLWPETGVGGDQMIFPFYGELSLLLSGVFSHRCRQIRHVDRCLPVRTKREPVFRDVRDRQRVTDEVHYPWA